MSKQLFSKDYNPWMLFFAIAVSAAVCEETLFRGAILSGLKDKLHPVAVILLVAFMFGVFHMSLYRVVPATLIGIWITWLAFRTGSIFIAMTAHLINNGLVVMSETQLLPAPILAFLVTNEIDSNGFPLWLVFSALVTLALMILIIELWARSNNPRPNHKINSQTDS